LFKEHRIFISLECSKSCIAKLLGNVTFPLKTKMTVLERLFPLCMFVQVY